MSAALEKAPQARDAIAQVLRGILFTEHRDEADMNAYAVLDGAAIPELLDQLYGDEPPEFVCLYRGELEPDLAECAPYLIHLTPESPFTEWLLTHCCGNHWGIFAISGEDIGTVRRHFRNFLIVKDPDGKQIYFRFYDPRVWSIFLPTTVPDELDLVFGPVSSYMVEERGELMIYGIKEGALAVQARR